MQLSCDLRKNPLVKSIIINTKQANLTDIRESVNLKPDEIILKNIKSEYGK